MCGQWLVALIVCAAQPDSLMCMTSYLTTIDNSLIIIHVVSKVKCQSLNGGCSATIYKAVCEVLLP